MFRNLDELWNIREFFIGIVDEFDWRIAIRKSLYLQLVESLSGIVIKRKISRIILFDLQFVSHEVVWSFIMNEFNWNLNWSLDKIKCD